MTPTQDPNDPKSKNLRKSRTNIFLLEDSGNRMVALCFGKSNFPCSLWNGLEMFGGMNWDICQGPAACKR